VSVNNTGLVAGWGTYVMPGADVNQIMDSVVFLLTGI
jgi:hypothetical protein